MDKKLFTFFIISLIFSQLSAQIFTQADPFYLLEQEKNSFTTDKKGY